MIGGKAGIYLEATVDDCLKEFGLLDEGRRWSEPGVLTENDGKLLSGWWAFGLGDTGEHT